MTKCARSGKMTMLLSRHPVFLFFLDVPANDIVMPCRLWIDSLGRLYIPSPTHIISHLNPMDLEQRATQHYSKPCQRQILLSTNIKSKRSSNEQVGSVQPKALLAVENDILMAISGLHHGESRNIVMGILSVEMPRNFPVIIEEE